MAERESVAAAVAAGAYHQVDATASWNITPQLAVYANAVNIFDEIIYVHTVDGFPIGFYENGPRYNIGARVKL